MQGHVLVIALSRTAADIEVTDRYGRVSRMSPSDSIHLVCNAEGYTGTGSKRRVRSISYCAPKPRLIAIQDSGFSGFNRYPMQNQSTVQNSVLRMAA
jgi:hypothetical protein